MKKLFKVMAALMAVVLMVSVFAACGKNETPDTSKDNADNKTAKVKVVDIALTDEKYAFAVDKNQPELLADVNAFVKEIMENGKFKEICEKYFGNGTPAAVVSAAEDSSKDQLVVATNAQFEPFEYKKGENFYGIDMEIAALLAEKLGKELVIKDMDFDAVCLSVGQHKCDVAMAGLTVNEKRAEIVNFSEPYYTANQKIIVKSDDTTFDACKTAADVEAILNGFDSTTKIGAQNGTTGQKYVVGDEEWEFPGFKASCVGFSSGSLAVQDLINGNIKYVIIDADPANFIVKAINEVA